MDKKSGQKIIQKSGKHFTDLERHKVIQELLSTQCTKQSIWQKYTGQKHEHGQLLRWMWLMGYHEEIKAERLNIASKSHLMKTHKPSKKIELDDDESFENLQLRKRIIDLERQLKDAELRAIAFSTMVDIAENEFKIPIRKKFNTKP